MTAKPDTPHLDALAELAERSVDARAQVRALTQAEAEHAQAMQQLKAERIAAYSEADEQKATALKRKAARAAAKASELEERRAGAELAAKRAQQAHDAYRAEHVRELLAEITPEAQAAARRLRDAAVECAAAWTALGGVDGKVNNLTRGVIPNAATPTNGAWQQLDMEIRRTLEQGAPQPPLPVAFQALTIAPEHDPDPEIREAARAQIRAGRVA